MSCRKFLPIFAIAILFTLAEGASAQSTSSPGSRVNEKADPILRIQLVISWFAGDKKISSTPYTLNVTPSRGGNIRMGVEVPITTVTGTNYRSAGTNIDCGNVTELSDGRYSFGITVQSSAVVRDSSNDSKGAPPMFRDFNASFAPILRDGQSMQSIVSSDPVTGEVVKIDVTLNVVR